MLLIDEQKSLIEKIVRANKNFRGNEDLFEDFCAEALQKSYMIFNSTSNIQKIESYVSKVVQTSIVSVLKDYGRVRRTNEGYVPTKEIKVADFSHLEAKSDLSSMSESLQDNDNITPLGTDFIFNFPDPKDSVEDIIITKDCLQRIADSVCVIHKEVPAQLFLDIFYMRYVKGLKQAEIAKSLNLSQGEVSKLLMHLSKLISNFFDSGKK